MGFCNRSTFCCALLCVHSSFAIISVGKRELVALVCLSSWCLMIVVWLFLAIPRVCLQFVIVVFLLIKLTYYFDGDAPRSPSWCIYSAAYSFVSLFEC